MTTTPALLPLFLPPAAAMPGASGALADACGRALATLTQAGVGQVVMIDSRWRGPRLAISEPAGASARALRQEICRQLAERDFWPDRADSQWQAEGQAYLGRWLPELAEGLLAVSVPPHAPERSMAVGEAIQAASAGDFAPAALVVVGATTRGGGGDSDGPAAFDRTLRRLLEQGEGAEILNVGAQPWIDGRPDAELAHLFVLLGAAPGHAATYLAAGRDQDGGYAVITFAPAPVRAPARSDRWPTVFPLTVKGDPSGE